MGSSVTRGLDSAALQAAVSVGDVGAATRPRIDRRRHARTVSGRAVRRKGPAVHRRVRAALLVRAAGEASVAVCAVAVISVAVVAVSVVAVPVVAIVAVVAVAVSVSVSVI